ncbi:MAG: hypothetical protein JNN30_10305, partial [Rhodanobacteraceae bacterium]|nr:hypothetical protein [Rhodanobacteraceae bacterium]
MSVREFRGAVVDIANGVMCDAGCTGRRVNGGWLVLLLVLLFLGYTGAAGAISPPTEDACPASGDPPVIPGSVRTHPGHWHNPRRSGTGWDFFYAESNTTMLGYWYTYNSDGAPVWYVTSPISLGASTQTWSGTLYQVTMSATNGVASSAIGEVSGRLYPGATRRMGLRWSLTSSFPNPPQECVYDIYGEAPIHMAESTPAFGGNWYDAAHSGWGYLYSMGRDATKYNEAEKLLVYDLDGKPTWLLALTNSLTVPGDSVTARGLTYNKLRSGYSLVTDCFDDPATQTQNECLDTYDVGNFSRTFISATSATINVSANVAANLGARTNRPVVWPNPNVIFPGNPQNGIPPSALTYPVALGKATLPTQVLVNSSYCEAASMVSTCNVYVGWSSENTNDRLFRYNLVSGARDAIGNSSIGYRADPLLPGNRVRYELRRGSALGALVFQSPEVLVSVGGGDSNSGPADVPPAPTVFQEPTPDSESDKVGAIAATFRVNDGGNATYTIPLYAPRGRGGLTPEVSLAYSSAGGEGLLGTGFNLHAASSIQKCRSGKEFGDGDTVSSALDQFCLDGQRLLLWKGIHMQPGAEYRTEIDSFQRVVLTATPVISSSAFGLSENLTTYAFTVYGKDGSVRRFGDSAGTVVAPVRFGRGAAISWLQTELADVSGNTIQFTYSSQGSGSLSTPGERTLQRISYVGGALEFSYITSGRRDISHSSIGDAYASQLLERVTVYGADNQVLRRYVAGYANRIVADIYLVRPRLISLGECADAAEQICYPATTFSWSDASAVADSGNSDATSGKRFPNLVSHRLADFDGDGRSDIVWADQGGRLNVLYAEANASGITFSANTEIARLLRVDPVGAFQTLDLDADGQDDVLYLSESSTTPNRVAWYLRRANGRSFAAPELLLDNVGPVDAGEVLKYESSLTDHTGDGLPDLVFRIGLDGNRIAILQRNPDNTDRPFAFAAPLPVRLIDGDASGLNLCAGSTYTARRDQERAQPVDIDGDGRADLGFMSSDAACGSGVPIVTGVAGATEGTPPPPVAHEGPGVAAGTPVGYYFVTYRAEGVFAGAGGAPEFRFTRAGRSVRVVEQLGPGSRERARQRVMAGDLNADGYMDYVFLNDAAQWRVNLTVADLAYGRDQCVANCLDANHVDKVQLIDFDGDSKPDFWWPDATTPNRNYKVHLWNGDGFTAAAVNSGFLAAAGNDWQRLSGDFDGDGLADNLIVKPVSNGVADGGWSVRRAVSHHQARGAIVAITNGLGARTEITYSPLTFSSVYRRGYDGPLRTWGRGSAVFDLALPNSVVHYVSSSAPVSGNPANQAIVQYQYRGLKLQAGGRGSLGFGRVTTVDLQTLVGVDTYLLNEFPLTGLAMQTNTRRLSQIPADSCRAGDGSVVESAACFSRAPICASGKIGPCDSALPEPNAGRVKVLLDTYGWRYQPDAPLANGPGRSLNYYLQGLPGVPASGPTAPVFVARIQSNIADYDALSFKSAKLEVVNFTPDGYDDFGNVLRSSTTSRRRSSINTTDETSVTTEVRNTYADNLAAWKLGRLTRTLTFTQREEYRSTGTSVTTQGRRASFAYTSYGLLQAERVEGMSGSSVDTLTPDTQTRGTATYYQHDAAGNRTAVFTCSADIEESVCRSGAGGVNYAFHPAGRSVMRYSRTEYDALRRYPERVVEPFSNGADTVRELVSSQVLARNSGGDVLDAQDANGKVSRLRYGRFGRQYFAYDATGASTRTTWRRCTANCPSGLALAYVQTTVSSGAPTRWSFHDLLGRPVIELQQGLNANDFSATLTEYDTRGNATRVSQPFFVANAGGGAATPAAGQTPTWTTHEYDFLNRVYRSTAPDGGVTTKDYQPLRTTTTLPPNASGQQQVLVENFSPQGEVISTIDANNTTVTFSYHAGGQLLRAERGSLATVSSYDSLGRKLSTSDPDTGTWSYTVNDAGETLTQTGPRGLCTEQRYDGRGRLWRRTDYAGACGSLLAGSASWQFDTASYGVGRLASEQFSEPGAVSVARHYSYNSLGQAVETRTDQDGRSYYAQSTYDNHGRPFQFFFTAPGLPTTGERTEYNAQGFAYRVRSAY